MQVKVNQQSPEKRSNIQRHLELDCRVCLGSPASSVRVPACEVELRRCVRQECLLKGKPLTRRLNRPLEIHVFD
jgi:hypothetical protein